MTQTIVINVPENATWDVAVTELHTLQDGSVAKTDLLPMKPGSQNVLHVWDGKAVEIREVKQS